MRDPGIIRLFAAGCSAGGIKRATPRSLAGGGGFTELSAIGGLLMILILASSPGVAQVAGGTVSGSVTNEAGAAIPGARVSIRRVATGEVRSVATNAEGFYAAPNLLPGSYEITVSAAGFSTQLRTDINITVGAALVLNVEMRPGNAQAVHRMKANLAVGRATAGLGGEVGSSSVENSPLNGRDWTQLATLQPGVTAIQTANAAQGHVAQHGFGAAMSISGGRPEQNSYRLDGISINDYSNGAPGSVLGANLGVDAVKQFSVLESNYPAQYGRTSGGVINAVTRSGTNPLHGDVYDFLRNSALDARNFFDSQIPPFRRNQFGGSAGGPVQKGRTFFFADYEGLRQSLGITRIDTVPSLAARAGQLSTGAIQVDPSAARYLQTFFPLPNGPLLGSGDTGIFRFAGQQVTAENYFTTRIDRMFSEENSMFGTYMRDSSKTVQPDTFNELLSDVVSTRQIVVLQQQHIFSPRFVNIVRFGFNRAVAVDGGVSKVLNPHLTDPSFNMIPGQFAGGISSVPGLTDFDGGPNAELPGTLSHSQDFAWNSYQGYDDALLTRGSNSLQFGVAVEHIQENESIFSNTNGNFSFSSLSNFLTNQPRSFEGLVPSAVGVFGTRQTLLAAYLQDDIRASRNFTLNAGLRYEMASVPTEAHNRISNLRNLTDRQPHLGAPYFLNPTLLNFEPRLGFAWDPLGSGNSAVRGGVGIFDVLPLPYEFLIITPLAAPYSQVVFGTSLTAGSFPSGAYQNLAANASALRGSYVEHSPRRNYVMQWNLSVERQLTSSLSVTAGYAGSRGVHQPFRMDDFNTVLPSLTPSGYLYPPSSTSLRLNPNFGRISGTVWEGNSFYDSFEAQLIKKVSQGLQFTASYTWGKSIDTSSVTIAGDSFSNSIVNPLFFDPRTDRGPSDFNIGQNFVASYTWEIPRIRMRSRVAAWGMNGWQLGGIYKAGSGVPFTPLLGGDPSGSKLTQPNDVPNLVLGPGCENPTNPGDPNHYIKIQCFVFPNPASLRGNVGRNRLVGPGMSNFDFSLIKNNPVKLISESLNIQFRAELFNILNRANFEPPVDNLAVFDESGKPVPSAGLITSTKTPAREIQFALKVIW